MGSCRKVFARGHISSRRNQAAPAGKGEYLAKKKLKCRSHTPARTGLAASGNSVSLHCRQDEEEKEECGGGQAEQRGKWEGIREEGGWSLLLPLLLLPPPRLTPCDVGYAARIP